MRCTTLVLAAVAALGCGQVAHAWRGPMETHHYRGIRPSDPHGREGLRNPERGFRIETLVAELPRDATWGPAAHLKGKVSEQYSDAWWTEDVRAYERDGLTLAQTYVYLDRFSDAPISEEKLAAIRGSLQELRSLGAKALLRFAYERTMDRTGGPTTERILGHIEQLRPIIREYSDVIYVLQAGFVGAWGEWHSSTHAIEADHAQLARIVDAVLEALPADRCTQVRVPKYKRWVLEDPLFGGMVEVTAETAHSARPEARIGFHNDGFLAGETDGGTWPEPPLYGRPGNPEFDIMTRESAWVPVDGELFWSDQGGELDGLRAAAQLRLHHYTSLSLAHSFSGHEGKPFSIDRWMAAPLTEEQIRAEGLPVSNGYFTNATGDAVARTQFEYIRDHLGYRIELQEARFPEIGDPRGSIPVEVRLVNRGFAALTNPRPVYLVLIDPEGSIVGEWQTEADPRRWQPYAPGDTSYAPLTYTVRGRVELPTRRSGSYRIGLWMPDASRKLRHDPRQAVRVANGNVPWWVDRDGRYGVNILGEVRVSL